MFSADLQQTKFGVEFGYRIRLRRLCRHICRLAVLRVVLELLQSMPTVLYYTECQCLFIGCGRFGH